MEPPNNWQRPTKRSDSSVSIIAVRARREIVASHWRARRLIAFLDSDDLWAPTKLERQLAFMNANPDCAISQTNEIWIRNGRRVNPGLRHRKRSGDIFIDSLRTCLISMSATMMRTELFRSLTGFDQSMLAAEDYDLWLRILIDHEAGLLDEPLVTRRGGHPDQTSATTPALDRFRILALTKLLADDRTLARAPNRGHRSPRREMPHLRRRPRATRPNRTGSSLPTYL